MTGQELLDYLRTDILKDAAEPYRWSDALILRMLSEAESRFARATYALLDSATITTEIGEPEYALPVGTIFVASAAVSTNSRDMENYTRRFIPTNLTTATGEPSMFICDERSGYIRVYPVPEAVITINLRVARLPTDVLATYSTPEIPEEYHLDLAEYAAYRLLLSNDVDGQNVGASARHEADWYKRLSDAKREYFRIRSGANPRAVRSWTFQRN
ncbi:MAG: hypothetical protein WC859_10050 [Elusimicrobiota bacterium]|jgi:hypothetical protein